MAKYYDESVEYGRKFLETTAKNMHYPNELDKREEKIFLNSYTKIQEDLTQEWRATNGTLIKGYDKLTEEEINKLNQKLLGLEDLREDLRVTKLILERIHSK